MKAQHLAVFAALTTIANAAIVDLESPALGAATHAEDWRPTNGFTSSGAFLNNVYNASFSSWGGFALSRETDATTPGYGNQYSAFTGSGFGGGGQYAVGYVDAYTPTYPTITLPSGDVPLSLRVTNTTYAALTMRDGDGFGFAKKFGGVSGNDPDWYKLIITGLDAGSAPTGTIEYYLADYRSANNALDYIVDDWRLVDLTSLPASTSALKFDVASSDAGAFGINTPTYFAVDQIATTVPEPATAACMAIGAGLLALRRKRV